MVCFVDIVALNYLIVVLSFCVLVSFVTYQYTVTL